MRTKNHEVFKAIEKFVNEYIEKHGVSPTVREIHAGISWQSASLPVLSAPIP